MGFEKRPGLEPGGPGRGDWTGAAPPPPHRPPPHAQSRLEPPDRGTGSVRAVPAPSPPRRRELHDFPSFQVGFGVFFLFLVGSWVFFPVKRVDSGAVWSRCRAVGVQHRSPLRCLGRLFCPRISYIKKKKEPNQNNPQNKTHNPNQKNNQTRQKTQTNEQNPKTQTHRKNPN